MLIGEDSSPLTVLVADAATKAPAVTGEAVGARLRDTAPAQDHPKRVVSLSFRFNEAKVPSTKPDFQNGPIQTSRLPSFLLGGFLRKQVIFWICPGAGG